MGFGLFRCQAEGGRSVFKTLNPQVYVLVALKMVFCGFSIFSGGVHRYPEEAHEGMVSIIIQIMGGGV